MNPSQENDDIRGGRSRQLKDSPLGRIPEDWDVVTVNDVAKITTGDKDTQDRDDSALYPFFVRSQKVERIGSFSFDGEAVLTAGDGVGVGKVFHYYVGRFDFHQRVYCIHSFTKEMNGNFFFQYFRQNFVSRVTMFSAKGSVDSVRLAMISEMLLPQPNKTEQDKIAEVISTVDRAIEQTEMLIAKQQSIKTGLMHDLLTRGIDEHGNLRSEQTHPFKDSPLGRIPVEWEVKMFEEITPPAAPIGYGIVQPGTYDFAGIRVAGIYTISSDFQLWHMSSWKIERAYVRSRIRSGDVLLSIKGTTGRVGVVPNGITGNISREIARIRPIKTINPHFLRFLMLSDFFQQYLGNAEVGTTRAEISIKILRVLYTLVPPLKEQKIIVSEIESIEQALSVGFRELNKLRLLKTGLMQDLLTGKRRVTPLLDDTMVTN